MTEFNYAHTFYKFLPSLINLLFSNRILVDLYDFCLSVGELVNSDPGLQSCLVVGVGEIARHASLPVPLGDIASLQKTTSSIEKKTAAASTTEKDKSTLIATSTPGKWSKANSAKKEGNLSNLFTVLESVYENHKLPSKIREQAIQTAGYLCVGQPDIPLKHTIIQSLLELSNKASTSQTSKTMSPS